MGMPFKIRKFVWPKTNVINRTINQSGGGSGGDLELGETSSTAYRGDRGKTAYDYSQVGHVPLTSKDATGGVAGLTLFKINFKNALNTITSFFTNANTVARTYTFQNRDGTIADDTDIQDAKDYADSLVVNLWDDRGVFDASANLFPATGGSGTAGAILKGDIWTISVVGSLGGLTVALGDTVRALVDTPAQTSSNWAIQEHGLGYTPESIANKDTDSTFTANSDTKYSSQKAIKTALDLKTNDTSAAFATRLHGATAKTSLIDADEVNGTDSANSFSLIRTTWTNVKAFLKAYFDTLYAAINNPTVTGKLSIKTTGTSCFHYIKSNSATVASAATIDLDLTEDGAGILTVYSARISSATYRTATVYFIFLRYGSWTLTSISTANGPSGSAAFTVTNPSDNIVRVTNNAGEDVILALSFSGTMGG